MRSGLFAFLCLVPVVLSAGGCSFQSSAPCDACTATPSTCANTILQYCISVNFADPECNNIGVTCPFAATANSPCNQTVCTGTSQQQNEDQCVSYITSYCSAEIRRQRLSGGSIDVACSSFSRVTTDLVQSFSTGITKVTPNLAATSSFSISSCARTNEVRTYLFSNTPNDFDTTPCLQFFIDPLTSPKQMKIVSSGGFNQVSQFISFGDNQYKSFVLVVNPTTTTFYLDGSYFGSVPTPPSSQICPSGSFFLGGRQPGALEIDGGYSFTTFYEYALSVPEVQALTTRCDNIDETQVTGDSQVLTSIPLSVPNALSSSILSVSGSLSLTSCLKQETSTSGFLFSNTISSSSSTSCFKVFVSGSSVRIDFAAGSSVTVNGASSFDDNTYHKLAVVIAPGTATVYKDGSFFGSQSYSGTVATCPTGGSLIGASPPSNSFSNHGFIDQLQLHAFALTSQQADAVFDSMTCEDPSVGRSTILDGTTRYPVRVDSNPPAVSGSMSVVGCVRQAQNNNGYLIANSVSSSSSSRCFSVLLEGTTNSIQVINGVQTVRLDRISGAPEVDDNQFHEIAIVVSGTNVRAFVDGTLFGTATASSTFSTCASGATLVGARSPGFTLPLSGTISDVLFFNRALSQNEIDALKLSTSCRESVFVVAGRRTAPVLDPAFAPPLVETNDFSVTGCMTVNSGTTTYIMSNANGGTCFSIELNGASDQFTLTSGANTASVSGGATFDDGVAHELAFVIQGTSFTAFVDGTEFGTTTLSDVVTPCIGSSVYVGATQPSPGASPIQGSLSSVSFHNFALSQADISSLDTCVLESSAKQVVASPVTSSTTFSNSGIPTVTNKFFVSGCVRMTGQTYLFANAPTSSVDSRCLHIFLDGAATPPNMRFFSNGREYRVSGAQFANNVEHQIALLVDDSTVAFYLDGSLYGFTTLTAPISTCLTGSVLVGGRQPAPGSFSVSGKIDNVWIGNVLPPVDQLPSCEGTTSLKSNEPVVEYTGPYIDDPLPLTDKTVWPEDSAKNIQERRVSVGLVGVVCSAGIALVAAVVLMRKRRTA